MKSWINLFRSDPVTPLITSDNQAINYYAQRDLLEVNVPPIATIWNLNEPAGIVRKQNPGGYWKSNAGNRQKAPAVNYDLFETFRQFSQLVEMYEFNSSHEVIKNTAVFSQKTDFCEV